MKEMEGIPQRTWREVFDQHHSALVDDVSARLDAELAGAVASVRAAEQAHSSRQMESARRATAEALNQTLRRMRQAPSETGVLQLLAEATAPWADKTVVLSIENNQVRALAVRNLAVHNREDAVFTFNLDTAGAIRAAIESKDPVVAFASSGEISPVLCEAFSDGIAEHPGDPVRAYLFPVVARQTVVAMLIAAGSTLPAPLEVLCEAAGMKLELLSVPTALTPLTNPGLIQIAASSGLASVAAPVTAPAGSERGLWEELSPDDQKLHLQAQRVARVRVAEMRLYSAEELRKGVFAGDIYGTLRPGIDAARTEFLQSFLSKSPTMVDYLHLEILRSLAHDDDRLLGKDYPGPMV